MDSDQPQQLLPGEDPDTVCQCEACQRMRKKCEAEK